MPKHIKPFLRAKILSFSYFFEYYSMCFLTRFLTHLLFSQKFCFRNSVVQFSRIDARVSASALPLYHTNSTLSTPFSKFFSSFFDFFDFFLLKGISFLFFMCYNEYRKSKLRRLALFRRQILDLTSNFRRERATVLDIPTKI